MNFMLHTNIIEIGLHNYSTKIHNKKCSWVPDEQNKIKQPQPIHYTKMYQNTKSTLRFSFFILGPKYFFPSGRVEYNDIAIMSRPCWRAEIDTLMNPPLSTLESLQFTLVCAVSSTTWCTHDAFIEWPACFCDGLLLFLHIITCWQVSWSVPCRAIRQIIQYQNI